MNLFCAFNKAYSTMLRPLRAIHVIHLYPLPKRSGAGAYYCITYSSFFFFRFHLFAPWGTEPHVALSVQFKLLRMKTMCKLLNAELLPWSGPSLRSARKKGFRAWGCGPRQETLGERGAGAVFAGVLCVQASGVHVFVCALGVARVVHSLTVGLRAH